MAGGRLPTAKSRPYPLVVKPFVNVVEPFGTGPYACPCCRYLTLQERGGEDICKVCFWQDDGQDDHDAHVVRGGPNRRLSLTEARLNFQRVGASDGEWLPNVRGPLPSEMPPDG